MKLLTLLTTAAAVSVLTNSASAALIITEIVDGDRIAADGTVGTSGAGDHFLAFVELTNTGPATVAMGDFYINNFNNGGSTSANGSTQLSGSLTVGQTFYFSYDAAPSVGQTSAFERAYGFAPNQFAGGKFINGDDVILLFDTPYLPSTAVDPSTVVDAYGALGTDGSGQPWDYMDTSAFRNISVTTGTSSFDESEWTFNSINAFDGATAADYQAATTVVPEPTVALLGGLGLLGLLRRRR